MSHLHFLGQKRSLVQRCSEQPLGGGALALMEDTPKAMRNMKIQRRRKSIFYVQPGGVQTPFIRAHAVTGTGTGTSASYLSWSMPTWTEPGFRVKER
jgi:hypothetical protein